MAYNNSHKTEHHNLVSIIQERITDNNNKMAPITRGTASSNAADKEAAATTVVGGELADFTDLLKSFNLNEETMLEIGRHGILHPRKA